MNGTLLGPLLFVVALIVLDLLALRFGANSRRTGGDRGDWAVPGEGPIASPRLGRVANTRPSLNVRAVGVDKVQRGSGSARRLNLVWRPPLSNPTLPPSLGG